MTSTHESGAKDWWADHRLRYNIALLSAGAAAFICYVGALEVRCRNVPEVEVTCFTTFFQAAGYSIWVGIANLFYSFGYWFELILKPQFPERYRRVAYAAGFSLSVALPFSIPAMILLFGCSGGPARVMSSTS